MKKWLGEPFVRWLESEIGKLRAELEKARQNGDQVAVAKIEGDLTKAQALLVEAKGKPSRSA